MYVFNFPYITVHRAPEFIPDCHVCFSNHSKPFFKMVLHDQKLAFKAGSGKEQRLQSSGLAPAMRILITVSFMTPMKFHNAINDHFSTELFISENIR